MGTLVSIDAWNRTTQSRVTVRAGASLNSSTLGAGGSPWEPCISRLPRFAMQLSDDDLTGQLMVGSGELAITAKDLIYAGDWKALDWIGSPIRVYSGEGQQLADMTLEFVGRVTAGVTNADNGQAALAMEVNKTAVDVPLLRSTYGGGGGSDGDVELRGTFKPAGFGAPVNVRPVLIDTINQVYQADGYGNLTGFAGVYENLGSFGASVGNYATYAALVAAGLREGQWATCIAEGMFRLGATATGVITCDPICGADLPGTMMLRWLQVHAGVPAAQIRSADFTALTTAVQAVTGGAPKMSFWTSESIQVLDLMQRVCASCNAVPLILLDGTIGVARCIGGPIAVTLNRRGGEPNVTAWAATDSPIPWWRMRMPAAKSYYVNSPSEIDYEDDVLDRGDYVATESYRQGNVVRWQGDGARYIYINAVASTGNAPPAAAYWALYQDAPDATQIRYPGGGSVFDKMQGLQSQIDATVADNILSRGEKPQWVITYNGLTGDLNSLNARYVALGSPADITAARNDANTKMTALGTYLGSLTPPWNDATTDTPIVANDFRAAWSNALISIAAFRAAITGRKGDKGEDGLDGTNGVPGAPGADGRTTYVHYAYANSPNGSIDFTTSVPGTRAFIGVYSDFVPSDSNDPAAYEWSAYKGPAGFGLVGSGDVIVASNALVKIGNGPWGSGGGYSTEGWIGGAQTSFKLASGNTMAGLNTDPANGNGYADIDYAWHCSIDGNTYIYESGAQIYKLPNGNDGNRTFQIVYDDKTITYIASGFGVVRQIPAPSGLTLYFDAAFAEGVGNKITDIGFVSSGAAGSGALTLVADTPTTYVGTNEVRGLPPFGSWGSVHAHSVESYSGGAVAQWTVPSSQGGNIMAGLGQAPNNGNSYQGITFAIYQQTNGYIDARVNGNTYAGGPAVNPAVDNRYRMHFDGETVRYFVNGVQFATYPWGRQPDPLYFVAALEATNPRVTNISFAAAGTVGTNGLNGSNGLPGPPGPGGGSTYLHIAYANSPDGTVDFTTGASGGRAYLGIVIDGNQADPTTPGSYEWSLIKGSDGLNGTNGTPGPPGANGQPTYVHIAYADNANGTLNFSLDNPTGRLYVGFYVDQVVADSSNPALYAWSLIKGTDGSPGQPGPPGPPGSAGASAPPAIVVTANGSAMAPVLLAPGQGLTIQSNVGFTASQAGNVTLQIQVAQGSGGYNVVASDVQYVGPGEPAAPYATGSTSNQTSAPIFVNIRVIFSGPNGLAITSYTTNFLKAA